MTNSQLNVILATALDKLADDRAAFGRTLKRYALAQALTMEEQMTEEEASIVIAAASLYELNDDAINPADDGSKEFSPIVITEYVTLVLEDLELPTFEVSAIGSLVAMQKHGLKIENTLHRLLFDIDTLVALDAPDATEADAKAAYETMSHPAAKRRLALLFGFGEEAND